LSSSAFETTLAFERGRSRALAIAVVMAWLSACLGVMAVTTHPLALTVLPVAALGYWIDRRRLQPRLRLWWRGGGDWRVADPEGPAWELDRSTWSTPWLILLVLRGSGRTLRIPVARDAVDPVVWRRLRARLRISGGSGAATGSPV
jgi:hypothetical protein